MNELDSNDELQISKSQEPSSVSPQKATESWQEYKARISRPGYQSPLIYNDEDDTPFTLKENLQLILNDIDEASPAETPGELVVKFLKALPAIAEALDNQPDYTQFEELVSGQQELLIEIKRLLAAILEVVETITEQTQPLKPLPVSQGSRTPRTEASPGLQRLRKLRKGTDGGRQWQ